MNTALWVAQAFVALVVTFTGTAKLVFPRERLARQMHWATAWPRGRIKLLGLAELAGAAGLIVPMATGIAPVLTPVAALCLAVLMAGAIRTHQRLGEGFLPAVVIGVLSVAIAAGRFGGCSARTGAIGCRCAVSATAPRRARPRALAGQWACALWALVRFACSGARFFVARCPPLVAACSPSRRRTVARTASIVRSTNDAPIPMTTLAGG
jgi:hypothetical protein